MPLPYSLTLAKGWRSEERGNYTAYIPKIAPVGMDIYMMGRYHNMDNEQLKELRADNALQFAEKISSNVTVSDMKTVTVDGCEALAFASKAPMDGRRWRQWAFIKKGELFVIVSAYSDDNESKIVPDVDAMVATFHVLEPARPFPGF